MRRQLFFGSKCFNLLGLGLGLLLGLAVSSPAAAQPWHGSSKGQLKAKLRADVLVQPHGSFVRRFQAIQSDKAEISDFVIFLNEWYEGGTNLGPYGLYHINQIALRLPTVDPEKFPIQVQPEADPNINEARRQVIVQALINLGVPEIVATERVVIAHPQAEGLRYEDIERVWLHSQLFQQPLAPFAGGFGFRGGFGGGLFGARPFGWGGGGWGGGARPIIFGY